MPIFNPTSHYFSFQFGWSVQSPADSKTYYLSSANLFNGNGSGKIKYVLPAACTFIGYSFSNINLTTQATSETSTLLIRKNDTTDTNLSTTILFNATTKSSDFTQNIAFAAGDDFAVALITPAWVTNPVASCMNIVFYFKLN